MQPIAYPTCDVLLQPIIFRDRNTKRPTSVCRSFNFAKLTAIVSQITEAQHAVCCQRDQVR